MTLLFMIDRSTPPRGDCEWESPLPLGETSFPNHSSGLAFKETIAAPNCPASYSG